MQTVHPSRPRHPRFRPSRRVAVAAAVASGTALHATSGFLALPATSRAGSVVGCSGASARADAGRSPPSPAAGDASGLQLDSAAPAFTGLAFLGAASLAYSRCRRGSTARRVSSFGAEGGSEGNPESIVPFEIRGVSLAQIAWLAGFGLIVYSFYDYFLGGGANSGLSSLTFIYAVPVLLLGSALQYAELKPVEIVTKPGAEGLFDAKQTPTLTKIKADVSRHRYGDDAHLDSSLKVLGLTVMQGKYPQLQECIEEKTEDGELKFTMLFESKDVPWTMWSDPQKIIAMDRFFGPGVWCKVYKASSKEKVAGLIITTGSRPAEEEEKKKKREKESLSVPTAAE